MKPNFMNKRVFNLIIVDESGSMSIIRKQALIGMNETLETIIKMQEKYPDMEQRVTLLTFDTGHTDFKFDNVPAKQTRKLHYKEYNPGGGTPLYDAIGLGISRVNALTTADDNVLVTIITDGEENSSCEYNLSMINNLIEKLKKQNWTFTFIGTDNLDVEGMAHSLGTLNSLRFTQDEEGTKRMFKRERAARARYCGNVFSLKAMADGDYFSEDDNDDKKS